MKYSILTGHRRKLIFHDCIFFNINLVVHRYSATMTEIAQNHQSSLGKRNRDEKDTTGGDFGKKMKTSPSPPIVPRITRRRTFLRSHVDEVETDESGSQYSMVDHLQSFMRIDINTFPATYVNSYTANVSHEDLKKLLAEKEEKLKERNKYLSKAIEKYIWELDGSDEHYTGMTAHNVCLEIQAKINHCRWVLKC